MTDRQYEAEKQVNAFIQILAVRYGLREDEIPDFIEAMRWAVEHKRNVNKLSWHAILGIMGALAVGFALIVWEGFKQVVNSK